MSFIGFGSYLAKEFFKWFGSDMKPDYKVTKRELRDAERKLKKDGWQKALNNVWVKDGEMMFSNYYANQLKEK